MSTTLNMTLKLVLQHLYQNAPDIGAPLDDFRLDLSDSLAQGTGAEQADLVWYDERSLIGASETLDFAAGPVNVFGAVLTFKKIRGLVIANKATLSGAALTIGGAAANALASMFGATTDTVIVGPGGILLLWSPTDAYVVTPGTGDLLKIDAGAATITYDIYVIGTSA
jgi:hypothetical protein